MFVCLIWGAAMTIASCCCCGTPATTTTGCCLSSQDFSLCLTRRCKKELQEPVEGMLFLPGQLWIMFDVCLVWGSSTPETTLTVCCLSSQDFSICLTQRCQKELQGPVVGMLLLSQDNYVWRLFGLGFRCKEHDRYHKLLKLWKIQHSWVKLN